MLVTLFATRSVDAEATTGLAANGHMMMVGESGEEPPFDADPRATRPSQWVAVEEAVAKCVSKPSEGVGLRGGWVVPFSSGSGVRVPQRQRKRHQPRRAAPFGASCDESPRIRPYKVVAPKGAARRRLGSAFALQQRLYFPLSAPRGLCEKSPNLGAEMPLPLGAAALALGVAFPQRRLRGLPPPRPIWLCLARPQSCPRLSHRARVAF